VNNHFDRIKSALDVAFSVAIVIAVLTAIFISFRVFSGALGADHLLGSIFFMAIAVGLRFGLKRAIWMASIHKDKK
jgi:hypothetical protein